MTPEIIDAAQEYIERITAAGIEACRINHNAISAKECRECGESIPEARRVNLPGVQTCIDCQQEIEDRERIMRGY
ncbi:TraR/DksA C4-type zinc finger protein [Pluralibacter gergoviae]|uniref:TraR/DksA C4-type zinc finger protein n=1 Tax=Pluralibacter gergoviae TaxID=61647 RepID=UPI002909500E|nr:TraR/DksA C4-type zinc finger protein [Pluralibacter gergoviae]MDU4001396.1 TraR/DksA C4-type zinc finger protein [Pluralibacter gergoviae]